jgi:hypothetical protein
MRIKPERLDKNSQKKSVKKNSKSIIPCNIQIELDEE